MAKYTSVIYCMAWVHVYIFQHSKYQIYITILLNVFQVLLAQEMLEEFSCYTIQQAAFVQLHPNA